MNASGKLPQRRVFFEPDTDELKNIAYVEHSRNRLPYNFLNILFKD